jgi:hypothetical protein
MKLQIIVALASTLVFSFARSEDRIIPAPGEGWRVRISAPKLDTVPSVLPSAYSGRAGRLEISFFVEPPRCAGGDSDENIYKCFATSLQRNPLVVWDTERANTRPNGIQVMYISQASSEKDAAKAFNINLLFARRGKWADIHVSIASPTQEDVKELFKIMDSITVEDEAQKVGQ